MQYKKKEVFEKILEAGRNEYLEKGFRAGNISAIAENSGVPVGNLYRYFEGKLGLLAEIVEPAYNEIPSVIRDLSDIDVNNNFSLEELIPQLTEKLLVTFDKYGKDILILVDKCANTHYGDFADKIYALIDELILRKIYSNPNEADKNMSAIIAKSFINSIFDLLRLSLSREELTLMVNRILLFYFEDILKRC